MSSFKRPGVYVQEVLSRQNVTRGVSADAVGVLIGACNRGPVLPTLVANWSEFTTLLVNRASALTSDPNSCRR